MKKALIIGALAVLVGCSSSTAVAEPAGRMRSLSFDDFRNGNVQIIADTQTGCQYALVRYGTGSGHMQVLYDENGKPLCGK